MLNFILMLALTTPNAKAADLNRASCVTRLFRSLGQKIGLVAKPKPPRAPSFVEKLGVDPKRARQIYYVGKRFKAGCPSYAGGRDQYSVAMIEPGSLDLLILTDTRDLNYQRKLAEIVAELKQTMETLAPGGRLLLVGITENIGDDFSRHARAAEALGLSHEPAEGVRGLFIYL